MIKAIFAMNNKRVIGKNNTLPWSCPEDLKLFSKKTSNAILIMGRLTWDSLPSKPLVGRHSVVLTKNQEEFAKNNFFKLDDKTAISIAPNIDLAVNFSLKQIEIGQRNGIFLIGGANIFEQMLEKNMIDEVHLTVMHDNSDDGDVKLPTFESLFNWTSCEKLENANKENISVNVYKKK